MVLLYTCCWWEVVTLSHQILRRLGVKPAHLEDRKLRSFSECFKTTMAQRKTESLLWVWVCHHLLSLQPRHPGWKSAAIDTGSDCIWLRVHQTLRVGVEEENPWRRRYACPVCLRGKRGSPLCLDRPLLKKNGICWKSVLGWEKYPSTFEGLRILLHTHAQTYTHALTKQF